MKISKIKNLNSGVALLFSILITSVLFAIALGTIEISLREGNFNTSTRKSNEALFAADTAAECALFYDKNQDPSMQSFPITGGSNTTTIECIQGSTSEIKNTDSGKDGDNHLFNNFEFYISNINGNNACAKVFVEKRETDEIDSNSNVLISTKIVSKGYDVGKDECSPPDQNVVERELQFIY